MNVLLDHTALVAALWAQHPRHLQANEWLARIKRSEVSGFIAQHSVAEVFATLTTVPTSPPFHPHSVRTVLGEALWHLQMVPLDEADYVQLLEEATDMDVRGNAVISLLQLRAAAKAGVGEILTVEPRTYPQGIQVTIRSL